jgi:CHASE2 domain-containing sensor protein
LGDNLENSVAPPQASPPDRVGFVNIYDDRKITDGADDSVRRYVLSRSPNPLAKTAYCKTNYSFAWQLVYRYFQSKNIPVTTSGKNWQFGSQVINRLVNPNWIRDRIVIVGVTAKSVPDVHDTAIGKIRGLHLHAHTASQTPRREQRDLGILINFNVSSTDIDEIPSAYKSIDRVMENQADLVEIVATIKQVICVKG